MWKSSDAFQLGGTQTDSAQASFDNVPLWMQMRLDILPAAVPPRPTQWPAKRSVLSETAVEVHMPSHMTPGTEWSPAPASPTNQPESILSSAPVWSCCDEHATALRD